jgi:DnaK suppressor protein
MEREPALEQGGSHPGIPLSDPCPSRRDTAWHLGDSANVSKAVENQHMSVMQGNSSGVKRILTTRRTLLKQRHERIVRDLQRQNEPLVGDSSDRAIQLQNDETLQAIDDATKEELAAIDEALERFDRGLYGICKRCGGEIEAGRLNALHAVTCAECANA